MKQHEDNVTVEMWEESSEVQAGSPNSNPEHKPDTNPEHNKPKLYRFYIELDTGEEVEWRGLSQALSKRMYSQTDKRLPSNVVRFGWEEIEQHS